MGQISLGSKNQSFKKPATSSKVSEFRNKRDKSFFNDRKKFFRKSFSAESNDSNKIPFNRTFEGGLESDDN